VGSCLWKESKWEDTDKEDMELHNWVGREIYLLSKEKRGVWVYK